MWIFIEYLLDDSTLIVLRDYNLYIIHNELYWLLNLYSIMLVSHYLSIIMIVNTNSNTFYVKYNCYKLHSYFLCGYLETNLNMYIQRM